MALEVEMLSGGLVTARDPSLLQAGELARAENGVYRPHSQAIHPVGFRVRQGNQNKDPSTGLGYEISGLRRLTFDGAAARMVIADGAGERWRYGPDASGNWTLIAGVSGRTAGLAIEAVHYGNRYALSNGVDSQYVISGDMTVIPLGMTPLAGTASNYAVGATANSVVSDVTNSAFTVAVSIAPAGQQWNDLTAGWYWYWITEYDSVNGIESAALGWSDRIDLTQAVQAIPSAHVTIQILYGGAKYPQRVNPNATHWRIYRSAVNPGTPTSVDWVTNNQPFPLGFLVETFSTDNATTTTTGITEVPIPAVPATTTRYDYGGSTMVPYPALTIEIAGVESSISRDTPPSWSFTSGDIFEDSLVTNDRTDKSVLRYSAPGLIHSWPELYFLGFDSRRADEITLVRSLGSILVVATKHEVWRVNYLPRAGDSLFDRGRIKDLIAPDRGVVGPQAGVAFALAGALPRLAFVSHDGLYMTDGLTVQPLTRDLDWLSTFRYGGIDNSILLNCEHLQALILLYVPSPEEAPAGSSFRSRALFLSYAPEHVTARGLKVSGPVAISAASADYDPDGWVLYTGGYDGYVRQEDQYPLTLTQAPFAELVSEQGMTVETRIIHLGGLDGESTIERLWILSERKMVERGIENVALMKRDPDEPIAVDEFADRFDAGALVRLEKHATAGGLGARLQGFAPLVFVGFEHAPRRGV